ncbi:hypothetical protein YC2023_079186 [Brassica napus]
MKAMKSESKEVLLVVLQKRDMPWWLPKRRGATSACRSGLRERPQWVALKGRSGLRFVSSRHGNASDLGASLWQVALGEVSRDRNASDLSMSLWEGCLAIETQATSLCRSGQVAPGCVSQRLHVVAPGSRSRQCSSKDHSNHLP